MIKLLHISANTYPLLNGKHHHTKNIWQELAKGFDEYHILARNETNRYNYSKERWALNELPQTHVQGRGGYP